MQAQRSLREALKMRRVIRASWWTCDPSSINAGSQLPLRSTTATTQAQRSLRITLKMRGALGAC